MDFMKYYFSVLFLLFMGMASLFAESSSPTKKWEPAGGISQKARDELLRSTERKPFPAKGLWASNIQALTAYWQGQQEKGDQFIHEFIDVAYETDININKDQLHWHLFLSARIILFFGKEGQYIPNTMGVETEKKLTKFCWDWLNDRIDPALVEPGAEWVYWGSENHHMQSWGSMWSILQVLKKDPEYSDKSLKYGSTVKEVAGDFDEYYKRWIRSRATRGLLAEFNSSYNSYTLSVIYNLVDFAKDEELRRLASSFLDLYWAWWALEQEDAFRGGSRHRSYAGIFSISASTSARGMSYYHFDIKKPRESNHPSHWTAATTSYTPNPLINKIVSNRKKLGKYQIVARLIGKNETMYHYDLPVDDSNPLIGHHSYAYDPECVSILRKTYATPSFIMGVSMVDEMDMRAWVPVSSQNRWDGITFAGKNNPVVFVQPAKLKKGSIYNSHSAVMDKGAMIIYRLMQSNAKDQRLFISKYLNITEAEGWVFLEAESAWAAIKIVNGLWNWEDDRASLWQTPKKFKEISGKWIVPEDIFSPIIIEVAEKSDYQTQEEFIKYILANTCNDTEDYLTYNSAFYDTTLTLHKNSKPPEINGKEINFEPKEAYAGEYLQGDFDNAQITVKAFEEEFTLDFN